MNIIVNVFLPVQFLKFTIFQIVLFREDAVNKVFKDYCYAVTSQ